MQLNFSLNILLSGISQSPESKLYEYNKYNELCEEQWYSYALNTSAPYQSFAEKWRVQQEDRTIVTVTLFIVFAISHQRNMSFQ